MLRDIRYFFILSRPVNVLIAGLAFGFSAWLATDKKTDFLSDLNFWESVGLILIVTATGYWVNDAFDFKIDRINKPKRVIVNTHLSVKKVFTAYFVSNILLLVASFFLQDWTLFLLNVGAVSLLFLYGAWLKRTTVIGNLLIAALAGLVIYYAGILYVFRAPLAWMLMFAFEITFIREVTKDMEDIRGDLMFHLQTLPIRIGLKSTIIFLNICYGIFFLSCFFPLAEEWLRFSRFNFPYFVCIILFVQLPAYLLVGKLNRSSKPADFGIQSRWLKWLILPGTLSLGLL